MQPANNHGFSPSASPAQIAAWRRLSDLLWAPLPIPTPTPRSEEPPPRERVAAPLRAARPPKASPPRPITGKGPWK